MIGHGKIRAVFDEHCAHVKYDQELLRRIIAMQEGFVNKKGHMEFFGGTLTGVQVVRFTDADRDRLFDTILEVDELEMETALHNLRTEDGHPVINTEHVRGSDVFNNACIYIIHKLHNSDALDDNQKLHAKTALGAYLNYKFLTSLMYQYFKYPARKETAAATYERLSRKFALKQHGSWGATLWNLSSSLVGPNSIRLNTISKMEVDADVERMINDMQSRVKDMLKNIYAVFMEVHAAGGKIESSSLFTEIEGEIELKDKTKSLGVYGRYLKSIVSDRNTFIKQELVNVVAGMMRTMSPRLLIQSLQWTSDNYLQVKDGSIDAALDIVMEHALDYMSNNREISHTDIGEILDRLRGAYMSSRSTDRRLIEARQRVEALVRSATGSKNDNAVAAARTAWMLYVVARAYTMRHYVSAVVLTHKKLAQ